MTSVLLKDESSETETVTKLLSGLFNESPLMISIWISCLGGCANGIKRKFDNFCIMCSILDLLVRFRYGYFQPMYRFVNRSQEFTST